MKKTVVFTYTNIWDKDNMLILIPTVAITIWRGRFEIDFAFFGWALNVDISNAKKE